jgi:hypothetical protein
MLLTLFALAALNDPVTIFTGVQIGDSPEEVARVLSGQLTDISGKPGSQMYFGQDGHVLFCNGRAVSIQRKVGRDLHAYTDSVQDKTAELGEPTMNARHYRTASGEISTLGAEWEIGENVVYSFGVIVTANGPIEVNEQLAVTGFPCQ